MDSSPLVHWLFLDLNAYFASVEQQEIPALRGKPVAVVPMLADTTCCIAASYEAKAFGIKTGTLVREAKALCPGLQLIEARQSLYVDYHQAILKAVESCIPIEAVLSIDEMISRLQGTQCVVENAVLLAGKIKKTLAAAVGPYLRCSIGVATNRYLAKVASDMQKPDGLTILRRADLPAILHPLSLRDLPGIGPHMEQRLNDAGIFSMRQLTELDQKQMHRVWGSIEGDRFYSWLQGDDTPEVEHHRSSIGHSHVLEPAARNRAAMYEIAKILLSKAARRLRKDEFWTSGMTLGIQYAGEGSWEGKAKFFEAQDTPQLLHVLADLWKGVPDRKPHLVSVTLHPLIPRQRHTPSLFENPNREKASAVMDLINDRLGKDTVTLASLQSRREKAPTRIAFSRIPDPSEF